MAMFANDNIVSSAKNGGVYCKSVAPEECRYLFLYLVLGAVLHSEEGLANSVASTRQ